MHPRILKQINVGKTDESNLIKMHDAFMEEYGWIPLEEFKKLPIPTFLNLRECIDQRRKQQKKENERLNKR